MISNQGNTQGEVSCKMRFASGESKHGKGNFAIEDIKKGEVVTLLTGEKVDRTEGYRRVNLGLVGKDDDLQIGEDLYLYLDEHLRLFNHDCDPNGGIRGESELFAIKAITKGDEITFDYSTTVGKHSVWAMDCRCGSDICRKIVGSILTIPQERLRWYGEVGALPDFIKAELG